MGVVMSIEGLVNIKKALSALNSKQVREQSEKPLHVALYAATPQRYIEIENYFLEALGPGRRQESLAMIARGPDPKLALHYDLAVYDASVLAPARSLVFDQLRPQEMVRQALDRHPELGLSLARSFTPFRRPFVDRVIAKTAKENTLFSLATAVPDIIPSLIELPWSVAEFATDSAFLTMNQIRMAFQIAGASDRSVGYSDQKSEIATIIASAFGWRAVARQLVGKIPFGGGLIPKAAIAYAGTKVLGLSLDHFYSIGYSYTRQEREKLYVEAFEQGKRVASRILRFMRPDLARKYAQEAMRGQRPATFQATR